VAAQASLFSAAIDFGAFPTLEDAAGAAGQFIATNNLVRIHAINLSFGIDVPSGYLGDGTNKFSSFIDWSARVHDVLYVVAGEEVNVPIGVPSDNFNGITVAMSRKDSSGKYRIVDDDNVFLSNPFSPLSERTYTDLLAPGRGVLVTGPGNSSSIAPPGTSFAAPHVTGGVALLQEHANTQIGNGVAGWTPQARRHEVMKAVLMNSADKVAGRLGSTRTVLKKNGDTWDQSLADRDSFIVLDEGMGAGHLNVARAVTQYASGAQGPNGVPVPLIGWDYDSTDFDGDINKYVLNQELAQGSYISITLAWDREVTFSVDNLTVATSLMVTAKSMRTM